MLATIAVKSQFLGANREINIGHHRTLPMLVAMELLSLSATLCCHWQHSRGSSAHLVILLKFFVSR
jgi:hypothetical protein